jgi:ATP-dependent RNA helicase DeaD
MTFALALDPFASVPVPLAAALRTRGFTDLTAVQRAVLEHGPAGGDLRISSQTGSGKTVAIGLVLSGPLLARSEEGAAPWSSTAPVALVITPTRELAAQIRDELSWLYADVRGARVGCVTGGTSIDGERRMLARGPSVLVGTPGRLLDHIRAGALDTSLLQDVVLDEADQMLDLGFRDELEAIVAALPEARRSHLVSATFPQAVVRLADRFQRAAVRIQGTRPGDAHQDIEHIAYLVRQRATYPGLVNLLLSMPGERVLIFVRRRTDASELADQLASDGFAAASFSGELAQAQRTRTLAAFRGGSTEILVSTDVAARGIDVQELSAVVHLELPTHGSIYTHRSGRTGRAGRKGRSLLLVPELARRRIDRILADARVRYTWQPLPDPASIRRLLAERARHELEQKLALQLPPDADELALVDRLVASRDPRHVLAALMRLATPKPAREPMPIPEPLRESHLRAQRSQPRGSEYALFKINYGKRAGATADRLMAHVCRRAKIRREAVGAIRIEATSSTFEISSRVADGFEAATRTADPREPELKIRRERSREASHPKSSGAPARKPRQ